MRALARLRRGAKPFSLVVAGTLAIGLHAGLIAFASQASARPAGTFHSARAVMVTIANAKASSAAAEAPEARQAPGGVEPVSITGARATAGSEPAPSALPAIAVRADARSTASQDPFGDYVDATLLSTRPQPEGTIAIPEPEVGTYRGVFKAVLLLFVDETGSVARVDVDRSDLPAEFEASAKEAFLRARFRPGLIGERPVRSRLRVEVGFDSGVPGV